MTMRWSWAYPLAVLAVLAASCSDATDTGTGAPQVSAASTSVTPRAPTTIAGATTTAPATGFTRFPVPAGSGPHDVAPAPDGSVWFTAQGSGELGRLDPSTGAVERVALGSGSRPHGVTVGPDGAPWITDGGLNAIVRVDPFTKHVDRFDLPSSRRNANLNTAAFDRRGLLWFTGQSGLYGRLDPTTRHIEVFDAPKGSGPYGITGTSDGTIWYASLAGSYLARVDPHSGLATVVDLPTPAQGARRVWDDSRGRLWVSEWDAGRVAVHDPRTGTSREWRLPGRDPHAYAVFVDDADVVWLTDFSTNALVRFDPSTERFDSYPFPSDPANVRQLDGRTGEVWGAESAADALIVFRTPRP